MTCPLYICPCVYYCRLNCRTPITNGGGRRMAGCKCSGSDAPPATRLSLVAEAGFATTFEESL